MITKIKLKKVLESKKKTIEKMLKNITSTKKI